MTRSIFAALLAVVAVGASPAQETRPNIILILADDIGISGFSCYGGGFKTPNVDQLAAEGVRFEHAFSAPLCAPTRALCMTGRYGFRTGVINNATGGKATPKSETIIAKVLKQAGYATAVAGKWRQLEYLTTVEEAKAWGFDEFLVWYDKKGGERYWDPHYNHNGKVQEDTKGKYGPDLCHDFVVDFAGRNKDKPFFVYYPIVLVHAPILRTPDSAAGGRRNFMDDNVAYLDKLMGKLVADLGRLGLREKTLIVFTGDNGKPGGGTVKDRKIDGGKASMKEGGARVPIVCSWKGTTPEGKVLPDLVDHSDLFPTFAELAGAKLPEGVTIDGRSFAPQLRGQPGKPREWVYVQLGQERYVRDARWKLYGDGTLCDMKDAPWSEVKVDAGAEGEAAAARKRLQAALDSLK